MPFRRYFQFGGHRSLSPPVTSRSVDTLIRQHAAESEERERERERERGQECEFEGEGERRMRGGAVDALRSPGAGRGDGSLQHADSGDSLVWESMVERVSTQITQEGEGEGGGGGGGGGGRDRCTLGGTNESEEPYILVRNVGQCC